MQNHKQEEKKQSRITRKQLQEIRNDYTEINDIADGKRANSISSMMHSMFFEDVGMIETSYMKRVHLELIMERYHKYKTIELAVDALQPLVIH